MTTANTNPRPTRFFTRERDGSVRVRMKFTPEEVSMYEEAAGETPVMVWLHQALNRAAQQDVREQRQARAAIPPPE